MGWDMVHVTSPEGWREVHVPRDDGVHRYVETAEVNEEGLAVFEHVGKVE